MSQHDVQPSTYHLRRRTPGSFLLVPFPAGGRAIRCQGQLEARAAEILAGCPLVASIQEQPLKVWYAWREGRSGVQIQLLDQPPRRRRIGDSQVSHVVPDFLVGMRDGTRRLVEVKPSRKLVRAEVQRKLTVARSFTAEHGWTFHVVTEQQLTAGPLLASLRLVGRYRQAACDPDLRDRLIAAAGSGPLPCGELLDAVCPRDRSAGRAAVFHLLATGRLDCELLATPLSDSTLISPCLRREAATRRFTAVADRESARAIARRYQSRNLGWLSILGRDLAVSKRIPIPPVLRKLLCTGRRAIALGNQPTDAATRICDRYCVKVGQFLCPM